MPQGKGTYGTKKGRPPTKKKIAKQNKGGAIPPLALASQGLKLVLLNLTYPTMNYYLNDRCTFKTTKTK